MNRSQKVSMQIEREWEGYVRLLRSSGTSLTMEQIQSIFYPAYTYGVGVGMQIATDLECADKDTGEATGAETEGTQSGPVSPVSCHQMYFTGVDTDGGN